MKDLKFDVLPTFRVSIHSNINGGLRGESLKEIIKMDKVLLDAILKRRFLPEIGDIIHFTSLSPDLTLKVTKVIPIMSSEKKLGNLVIHGESKIFKPFAT